MLVAVNLHLKHSVSAVKRKDIIQRPFFCLFHNDNAFYDCVIFSDGQDEAA